MEDELSMLEKMKSLKEKKSQPCPSKSELMNHSIKNFLQAKENCEVPTEEGFDNSQKDTGDKDLSDYQHSNFQGKDFRPLLIVLI